MTPFLLALGFLATFQTAPEDKKLLLLAEQSHVRGIEARLEGKSGAAAFRQTASILEQIRQEGAENAVLYRLLGDSYLLAGDLPRAIFTYRLGLARYPANRSLRDHLSFARSQVVYREGDRPRHADLGLETNRLMLLSPRSHFYLCAISHVAGCLMLLRWAMNRQLRWLLLAVGLFGVTGISGYFLHLHQRSSSEAVVVVARDGVILRQGNGFAFPASVEGVWNRGVEGRLLYSREDWRQVQLAGGAIGWMHRSELME